MSRQQGPGHYCHIIALFDISQQVNKRDRFFWIRKDTLTAGTSVVYVVQPTLDQDPWPSRHVEHSNIAEANTTLSALSDLAPI